MNTPDANSVRDEILDKTRREIDAFVSIRGKSRVFESNSMLSLNVSEDYGDRFLVELIQNAHDAHPADRNDGRIEIRLCEGEGAHGCLYVANGGAGFRPRDFESLTNIALSSKLVNAGAGNKGLGFRSVLQICQWPEIYSSRDANGAFDGYCFGFAQDADLAEIVHGSNAEAHLNEIGTLIPRLSLPSPRNPTNAVVVQYAGDGFATVVRLPLDSEASRAAVEKQLRWLRELDVPIQLFLNRLCRITVRRNGTDSFELPRKIVRHDALGDGMFVQLIDVGGARFVVADAVISESEFREELNASVQEGAVPLSWKDWTGAARVAVAVPLDRDIEAGRLYCFLPLGKDATAPFPGFINANFYTHIDRRRVHDDCRLNEFFIGCAAWACCTAIAFLVKQNRSWAPRAVVDLLSWTDTDRADLIKAEFDASLGALGSAVVAPVLKADGRHDWVPLNAAKVWRGERNVCLTATRLVEATTAPILLPALGEVRTHRLTRFLESQSIDPSPTKEQVAGWIGSVAKWIVQHEDTPKLWMALYEEVASTFESDPEELDDCQFLRADDAELFVPDLPQDKKSKRRPVQLYFRPVQTPDDEGEEGRLIDLSQFPAVLRKRFAFIDDRLTWIDSGRRQTKARRFLEGNRFVREYQTRDVLRSLAEITRDGGVADSTRRTALEWAFRVWVSGRGLSNAETAAAGLYVPVRGGWLSAADAMFGDKWPSIETARRLERFLAQAGTGSTDLNRARERILIGFADLESGVGTELEWARFLSAAGVVDYIRPILSLLEDVSAEGYLLSSRLAEKSQLGSETKKTWLSTLGDEKHLPNPYTLYRASSGMWVMPGQEDAGLFTEKLRVEYAIQILRTLAATNEDVWHFKVLRPNRSANQRNERSWPSPLAAFVRIGAWLPARKAQMLSFARPRDAWLHSSATGDIPPSFLSVVHPECCQVIERAGGYAEKLRLRESLRVLGDPRDARMALIELAEVVEQGSCPDREIRRFKELFTEAWNEWMAVQGGISEPVRPDALRPHPPEPGHDIRDVPAGRHRCLRHRRDMYPGVPPPSSCRAA